MRTLAALGLVLATAGCGSVDGDSATGDAGRGSGSDAHGDTQPGAMLAPYYYSYGWGNPAYAFSSLADMKAKGGPAAVTVGFVLSNGGCEVTSDIHGHLDDVRAYTSAGGHVRASFGGAVGMYLEYQCGTAALLAAALGRFIDDTGITDLDFDLEQHAQSSNPALNALRGQALKQLQDSKRAQISFTLPVTTAGLLPESTDILKAAITAGVQITFVNALTMDYGAGTDLMTAPAMSVDALVQQMRVLLPAMSVDELYHHLGVTPMIGENDDGVVLTTAFAQNVVSYVRQKQLGLVSYWAVQRDQACTSTQDLGVCSRHNTKTFEFDAIFEAATTR
ncbi:MAG TPA: hypothetical protein VGC42_22150 [Kofleriaceae bacterium]